MPNILPFLKSLLSVPGISGYEAPAARLIESEWGPLVDELSLSLLGSVHGFKRGAGADPRPSVMLAAHMDVIGMMVSGIEDGFLHIAPVGGLDPRILPGQSVIVHAREDLPGVIAMPTSSGTDSMAMQVTAAGIPTFVMGIPIRYMHTPVEMVALKDIQRAGRLLAEFVASLEPDFLSAITWED